MRYWRSIQCSNNFSGVCMYWDRYSICGRIDCCTSTARYGMMGSTSNHRKKSAHNIPTKSWSVWRHPRSNIYQWYSLQNTVYMCSNILQMHLYRTKRKTSSRISKRKTDEHKNLNLPRGSISRYHQMGKYSARNSQKHLSFSSGTSGQKRTPNIEVYLDRFVKKCIHRSLIQG